MLRIRLLAAVAATAFAAGASAYAQTPQTTPTTPPPMAAGEAGLQTQVPAPPPVTTPAPVAEAAQTAQAATPATADTVIDVLRAQGNFTTLLTALDQAQLTDTLRTRPAVSIFAPTDAAFAALPEAERTRLMDPANAQELRSLLLYHVIVADVSSDQIEGAKGGVETASRTQVLIDGTGEAIKVDAATVTQADIDASNGSVFAIDQVLNPANSMAAVGDEEAATAAASAAPAAEAVEDAVDEATDAVEDATDAVTAPLAVPAVPAVPATPAVPALPATPAVPAMPSAAPIPTPHTSGVTATTRPATGEIAPNGLPAATTTTIQAPPVPNPTDGQVDHEEDPQNPAPTPTPQG